MKRTRAFLRSAIVIIFVCLLGSCGFADQTTPSTQIDAMIEAAKDNKADKCIMNASRSDMEAHLRACDTINVEHN